MLKTVNHFTLLCKVGKWSADTLDYFIRHIVPDRSSGAFRQKAVDLHMITPAEIPQWHTFLPPGFVRKAGPEDLLPGFKDGVVVEGFVVDTDVYMDWLVEKFRSAGGTIVQRAISDLAECFTQYNVVVNCSGLGSRDISPINDHSIFPTRGQTVVVKSIAHMAPIYFHPIWRTWHWIYTRLQHLLTFNRYEFRLHGHA